MSDYGLLEEFVFMVTEIVPQLLSTRQRAELILGLRARVSHSFIYFFPLHFIHLSVCSIGQDFTEYCMDSGCEKQGFSVPSFIAGAYVP